MKFWTTKKKNWIKTGGIAFFVAFLILILTGVISFWYLLFILLLGAIGVFTNKSMQVFTDNKKKPVDVAIDKNVMELMTEIRLRCDQILVEEIDKKTGPVINRIKEDFAKSMQWLWEDSDNYLSRVELGISETRTVIQLSSSLSDDSMKTEQKLQSELDILIDAIDSIKSSKEKDNEFLEKCLAEKTEELETGIADEKELFFDYVQKLLTQQMSSSQEGLDMGNYFDAGPLGEQFSMVIEKSLEARLKNFEDSIIQYLEEVCADIVGRMQSIALRVMNVFRNIENIIEKMRDEYQGDDSLDLRKLADARERINRMKQQSNEIMVTLSWQDTLVEKRWQELQEGLLIIKDRVMTNISDDVIKYLQNSLDDKIVGYRVMADGGENALIYKAVLDSEAIYQVFVGENLLDIIGDGTNVLLQFIRPVELLAMREIRLNEYFLNKRSYLKDQIKQDEYQAFWHKIMTSLQDENPDLPPYLENTFPLGLASFCNNPFIGQKPENLSQAAWMLFIFISEKPSLGDEIYLLAGMLLIMHRLRNKYIHPLRSKILPLQNPEEVKYMRSCALQIVNILLNTDMKSLYRSKRL